MPNNCFGWKQTRYLSLIYSLYVNRLLAPVPYLTGGVVLILSSYSVKKKRINTFFLTAEHFLTEKHNLFCYVLYPSVFFTCNQYTSIYFIALLYKDNTSRNLTEHFCTICVHNNSEWFAVTTVKLRTCTQTNCLPFPFRILILNCS